MLMYCCILVGENANKRCYMISSDNCPGKINEKYVVANNCDTSENVFHFFSDADSQIHLKISPSSNIRMKEYIRGYILPKEKELYEELRICIIEFKRKHPKEVLYDIHFMLIDFESIAIKITNEYAFYRHENVYEFLENAIRKSILIPHMDKVLCSIRHQVSNIECNGCIQMVRRKYIKTETKEEKIKLPPKILDVEVVLKLDAF